MSVIRHPFVSESWLCSTNSATRKEARVIFIHMNHTNPLLIDGSPAQAEVENRGFRVAKEGLRLPL